MGRKIDDLFGSMRMVLPEHKVEIQRMNSERGLVERPVIVEITVFAYMTQRSTTT